MRTRIPLLLSTLLLTFIPITNSSACCPVAGKGSVVNADQAVIMVWDEARQMQHFVRRANFKTDAPDVGFIVPSPSRPELAASGNEAFPRLEQITAPAVRSGGFGLGCSASMPRVAGSFSSVRVIEEKRVAGFDTTVLTAESGTDLTQWLKAHGYPYSPEVAAWAQPYLGGTWHFTALKVAADTGSPDIRAASLRISFRTDRPLFPYREPDSAASASHLSAPDRLLRIYFISDTRYRGEIDGGRNWSGKVVWSGDVTSHRSMLLNDLKLPGDTLPGNWWLTEFEDHWPYEKAAGDVYFTRDRSRKRVSRPEIASLTYPDSTLAAFVAVAALRPLRRNRRPGGS